MNPNNYGTLPACQRLAEAGIVLETEKVWHLNGDKETYSLQTRGSSPSLLVRWGDFPAPSMAEVWRELPDDCFVQMLSDGITVAGFVDGETEHSNENTNPTDALIDLLIWVKGQGKEKKSE